MLVDIFLPAHTLEFIAAARELVTILRTNPDFDPYAEPCPSDMRLVGRTCVDTYPFPNLDGEDVLLGVSALPEPYLEGDGRSWDCLTICSRNDKRLCSWSEWQAACDGTPEQECGPRKFWIMPDWARVMRRAPREMAKLDQHFRASERPGCVSKSGVRMMTLAEEWVTYGDGYAFSRGFWAREGGCSALNTTHSAAWHGYSNACRCCKDAL